MVPSVVASRVPMRAFRSPLALAALLTLSGASGLVFEVIWLKQLALVLGQTTTAASLLVACFLGGLALGSFVLGRVADRVQRPLALYAVLELASGVLAIAVSTALPRLDGWLAAAGLSGAPFGVRLLIAAVLLLLPTFAMGGTVPAAVRHAVREGGSVGRSFGFLYSFNTLGAAIGCAVAGFFLIGRIGLWHTSLAAAAGDLLVAGAAALLAQNLGPAKAPASEKAGSTGALLIAAIALGGFASIAYEILWVRLLITSLEATSYAFTVVLVTYLLGIVAGGFVFTRWLSRGSQPLATWAGVQLTLAVAAALGLLMLGEPGVLLHVARAAGLGTYSGYLLATALAIAPATLAIGIGFPLMGQVIAESSAAVGARLGWLYGVNTIGGIAGSLATGLWLIPAIGTQKSYLLATALCLVVAALAQAEQRGPSKERVAVGLASVVLLLGLGTLPRDFVTRSFARSKVGERLATREGREGSLIVLGFNRSTVCGGRPCPTQCRGDFSFQQLRFGPLSYANTVLSAGRYMRTLAHLPMLMHEKPAHEVLEVCFGTGSTAGAFASWPEVRHLTIVDLNQDVFDVAPLFSRANHDVLRDPRVTRVLDDGRHFLDASAGTYDVISFEPPPPTAVGATSLYTREFYELISHHLADDGLLTQWIPLADQSDALSRSLIRTMLDVFPDVSLWIPSRAEAVLVASKRPQRVDLAQWASRWNQPSVAANLAGVAIDKPVELLGAYVAGTEALRRYTQGYPPITDDLPLSEYFRSVDPRPFDSHALLGFADQAPLASPRPSELDARRAALKRLIDAQLAFQSGEFDTARDEVLAAEKLTGKDGLTSELLDVEYGCFSFR
jgi:spermidine synthase